MQTLQFLSAESLELMWHLLNMGAAKKSYIDFIFGVAINVLLEIWSSIDANTSWRHNIDPFGL